MSPWIKLLRPKQWIKNGFVFAPLFFAGQFASSKAWYLTLEATLSFLLISCIVYVINDIRDVEEDRLHPVKRKRPIAAGKITRAQAGVLACLLVVAACCMLSLLPRPCIFIALCYVLLNVLYTFYLKRMAILDIFFIAFCYVLRVLMGCYALAVTVSPWIILSTFFLALFLGFGKRYHEMGHEEYVKSKPNLQHYSKNLLDRLVTITGGSALMTYAIYAAEIANRIGKVEMIYTVGFVAFGLFRYLQSIHVYNQGGEPEMIILKDRLQLANLALWLITTLIIMF